MGTAYFIAGVIPGLFIRERQYDPQQSSLVKPAEAEHGDSVGSVTAKKPTRPATASQ
jgi:AAHS family cis,cis-muconate transporter-like MFS transporter